MALGRLIPPARTSPGGCGSDLAQRADFSEARRLESELNNWPGQCVAHVATFHRAADTQHPRPASCLV